MNKLIEAYPQSEEFDADCSSNGETTDASYDSVTEDILKANREAEENFAEYFIIEPQIMVAATLHENLSVNSGRLSDQVVLSNTEPHHVNILSQNAINSQDFSQISHSHHQDTNHPILLSTADSNDRPVTEVRSNQTEEVFSNDFHQKTISSFSFTPVPSNHNQEPPNAAEDFNSQTDQEPTRAQETQQKDDVEKDEDEDNEPQYHRCLATFPTRKEYEDFKQSSVVYCRLASKICWGVKDDAIIALIHFDTRTRGSTVNCKYLSKIGHSWDKLLRSGQFPHQENEYGTNTGRIIPDTVVPRPKEKTSSSHKRKFEGPSGHEKNKAVKITPQGNMDQI